MRSWLPRRFGRGRSACVAPAGMPGRRRLRPPKAFVIVIVLALLAELALVACGVEPATGIQVVAAVLGAVETVRRLTAKGPATTPGAVAL